MNWTERFTWRLYQEAQNKTTAEKPEPDAIGLPADHDQKCEFNDVL